MKPFLLLLAICIPFILSAQEDLANQNLNNVNSININDPGPNEGIKWLQTNADWTIDVTPTNRNNVDGNLNIYGISDKIALWRPLLLKSTLEVTGSGNHYIQNGNFGLGTQNPQSKISIRNVNSVDGARLIDFSEGESDSFIFKGNFLGTGPTGNTFFLGSGNNNWEPNMMSWRGDGNVGIGVVDPQTKLHISSETSGDAVLKIEADTDNNNNEEDNVWVEMHQDGGKTGAYIGFNKDWGGPQPDNIFRIGTRWNGINSFNSLVINSQNGNVGIGTNDPQSKLAVNGGIRATKIIVLADINVPDYVFESDYTLLSLKDIKSYIEKNKHLPEIPSASEIGENGIDIGEMNMKLLQKVEELTLHLIDQSERMDKLQEEIVRLKQ